MRFLPFGRSDFVVAGKQRLMPFFNRSNNVIVTRFRSKAEKEHLILAIQSAGVSNGRNGFFARKALRDDRKDKSGEKLAESEVIGLPLS